MSLLITIIISLKMEYTIALCGSGVCGKTTFVRRLLTNEFYQLYEPDYENSVLRSDVKFNTDNGEATIHLMDFSGSIFGPVPPVLAEADAVILMFDLTSPLSYEEDDKWDKIIIATCKPDTPIVLCGTKADIKERRVSTLDIYPYIRKGYPYCEISTRTGSDINKPFEILLQQLTGIPILQIIE